MKIQRFQVKRILSVLVAAGILPVLSCNVGLGDAVDTMTPKLKFTGPTYGATLAYDENDTIKVTGTWDDDTGISNLTFSVVTSSDLSSTVEGSYYTTKQERSASSATGSDGIFTNDTVGHVSILSGTWQVSIPKGKINDGDYTIVIKFYDYGSHEVELTRPITIDSTPPLFLLSKPNSTNTESPSSYGRNVIVKGAIADLSSVGSMKVHAYDSNTFAEIPLYKDTFNGFDKDAEITIAQWTPQKPTDTESVTYALYQNYIALYGGDEEETGDKSFYLAFELTDTAGNTSHSAYINSNLQKDLNSDSLVKAYYESASKELKRTITSIDTTDLRKIFDGSYTGIMNEATQARVKSIIKENTLADISGEAGISSKLLICKINKDADPTYEIQGYPVTTTLSEESGITSYTFVNNKYEREAGSNESKMAFTLKVSAGKDGTLINPKSITGVGFCPVSESIHTYSDILSQFQSLDTNEKREAYFKGMNGLWLGQDKIKSGDYTLASDIDFTDIDLGYYDISVGEGLRQKTQYIIIVGGEDVDGNPFEPAHKKDPKSSSSTWYNGYGVKVVPATTNPPTITVNFENNTILNHDQFSYINSYGDVANEYTVHGTLTTTTPIDSSRSYFTMSIINENDANDKVTLDTELPLRIDEEACIREDGSYPPNFIDTKEYNWYLCDMETFLEKMKENGAAQALTNILSDHTLKADSVTKEKYPETKIGDSVDPATGAAFATPLACDNEEKPMGGTYLITINIHMENQGDIATDMPRSFTVDSQSPVVTMGDVLPIVVKDTKNLVNGLITFSANASDVRLNNAKTASELLVWGTPKEGTEGNSENKLVYENTSTANNFKSKQIDTTKFKDDTEIYFAYTASDTAGNKWTVSNNQDYVNQINNSIENRRKGWGATYAAKSYIVNQESDRPQISLNNADSSITDTSKIHARYTEGDVTHEPVNLFNTDTNTTLLGTITDDDGIKSIRVFKRPASSINDSEWESLYNNTSIGNTSYSLAVSLPTVEGEYQIKVEVTDTKGETSCSTGTTTFVIAVDKGKPEISNPLPSNDQYFSNEKTMNVSATIKEGSSKPVSITLIHTRNGESYSGDEVASSGNYDKETETLTPQNGIISFTDIISPSSEANGNYTAHYVFTDCYKNYSDLIISYKVDKDPPSISFTELSGKTESDGWYLPQDNTYTFTGKASDSVSGIEKVIYFFDGDNSKTEDARLTKDDNDENSYNWKALVQLVTPGTSTALTEGEHTITFQAVDGSGKVSSSSAATKTIYVDSKVPALSFSASPAEGKKLYKNDFTLLSSSGEASLTKANTYYGDGGFTLSVSVNEKHLKSARLSVNGESSSWTSQTDVNAEKKTFTYEQSATDGSYTYTITATDLAGHTTTESLTLIVDTLPPNLSITAPAKGDSFISNSITLTGTHSDPGSGTKIIRYSIEGEDANTLSGEVNASGATWKFENVDLTKNKGQSEKKEGSFTLKVTAEDYLGHTYKTEGTVFTYDNQPPELTINSPDTEKSSTFYASDKENGFTISGVASDTNALAEHPVIITLTPKNGSPITVNLDSDEAGNWEVTFPVGLENKDKTNYLADFNSYSVKVSATDIASKKTEKEFSLVVDTEKPSLTDSEFTDTNLVEINGNKWFKNTQVAVSVSAGDGISGIDSVEYKVNDSDEWLPLRSSGGKYTGRVTVTEEGSNTIYLQAKDKAGNISDQLRLMPYMDTTEPGIIISEPSNTTQISKNVSMNYSITITDPNGSNASGIDSTKFSVTLNGVTDTSTTYDEKSGLLTGTFSKETIKSFGSIDSARLEVKAYDKAGNSYTISQTLNVDNEEPAIVVSSPLDKAEINGLISINGTASDNSGIKEVFVYTSTLPSDSKIISAASDSDDPLYGLKFRYDKNNEAPGTYDESIGDISYKISESDENESKFYLVKKFEGASAYNWKFTNKLDTKLFEDGSTIYGLAKAVDTAGNESLSLVTLKVDQDADRPEIRFNNFKILNMTSSSPNLHKQETLYGTIKDDDGAASLKVSSDGGETWTDNLYTSGSWEYTVPEGENTLLFQVVDAEGTIFTSTNSSEKEDILSSPRLIDSSENKLGYRNSDGTYPSTIDSKIYITKDTQNPELETVYWFESKTELTINDFSTSNKDSSRYISYPPLSTSDWKKNADDDRFSNQNFGGTESPYIYLLVAADDTNGIGSIGAKLNGVNATAIHTGENTNITLNGIKTKRRFAVLQVTIAGSSSGNSTLEWNCYDAAERPGKDSVTISIDNSAPVVSVTSPAAGSTVFATSTDVNIRGNVKDSLEVDGFYMAVTKTNAAPALNVTNTDGINGWTNSIHGDTVPASFSVIFAKYTDTNGVPQPQNGTSDGINYYCNRLDSFYKSLFDIGDNIPDSAVTEPFYIWFYAKDELGNTSEPVSRMINVNPHGDVPSVTVDYPTVNLTTGGTIRISGSSSVDTGTVDSVYIQIDPAYNGTTFSSSWADSLSAIIDGKSVGYSISDIDNDKIPTQKGILASGNPNNWNLSINKAKEFKSDSNVNMAIRVYAVSSTGKVNEEVVIPFVIDSKAPVIGDSDKGPITLIRYENGVESASQPYESGMWLNGEWYLTCSLYDESGISEVKWTNEDGEVETLSLDPLDSRLTVCTDYAPDNPKNNSKNYNLKIPVGKTSGAGSLTYNISITDAGDGQSSEQAIILKYDNTDPVFHVRESATDNLDERPAEIPSTGNAIQQANGTYTFYGTFDEDGEQSGFERIAFYFTRTITENGKENTYVIDTMLDGGDDGKANRELVKQNTTDQAGYTKIEGLYWIKDSAVSVEGLTLTLSMDTVSEHIRKGGLCRINDVNYLIKDVDDDAKQVTIATDLGSIDSTTVYFAIGQVVDNKGESSFTTAAYNRSSFNYVKNNDDDQMRESVNTQGNTTLWDASINSSLILDGPVDIHFVAYDKAGNYSEKTYSGTVSNNQPRIAGVMFGTDENGNDSVDDSELNKTYQSIYTKEKTGFTNGYLNSKEKVTEMKIGYDDETSTWSSVINIKGTFKLVPEIVGGNTGIDCTYTVTKADGTKYVTHSTKKELSATHSSGDAIRKRVSGISDIDISLKELLGSHDSGTIVDGNNQRFEFTLWDRTEGLVSGSTSQNAKITICANVSVHDKDAPTVAINPFYWKGKDNNSLFANSSANGHIELGEELPGGTFNTANTTTSGLYDNDPKVSGMIAITGTANDKMQLASINVTVPGFNSGSPLTLGSYSNGAWTGTTALTEGAIPSGGWASEVTDVSLDNETGHTAKWTLYLDSAQITNTAEKDVIVFANATDKGDPTLSDENISYTPNSTSYAAESWTLDENTKVTVTDGVRTEVSKPYYKMDVVPYVVGIKTGLSSLKKNNSSVYDRTSLGHYSVSSTEDIYLYGFNLKGGTLYDSAETPNSAALTETDVTSSFKWYSTKLGFTKVYKTTYDSENKTGGISAFASGDVSVKVHEIESLNNRNTKDAKGQYTETTTSVTGDKSVYDNYYNRQPNGDNNNLLTDDVTLDIWEINSEAGKPTNGPLSQPVMAINPKNKQVGFAFANGPLRFSMGSLDKSYDFWEYGLDFWTSIGFAYDANGNSFGTAAGGDINATKADSFGIFTSRWSGKGWTASTNGHNNGTGQLRLELIGQAESTDGSNFNGDNVNKERIKSPSIATTVASADATDTNVYLAYYDEINDEIRFKWGIFSDSTNQIRKGRIYYAGQDSYYNSINDKTSSWETGLFADYYGPDNSDGSDNSTKDTTTKTVSLTKSKEVKSLPYTLEYVSLIAGQTTGKYTFVPGASGTKYTANTAVMTNEDEPQPVYAGQYISIAAKYHGGDTYNIGTEEEPENFTDDLIVAVWYDATNNQMLYSYNTKPQKIKAPTYKGNNYNTIDSYSQSATGWSTPVAIFGEGNGIGEYCKVALDANGKVHIACYDNANADVWYAYIDDYASPSNAKTCIVDSYGIVGTELYLDIALKNSKPVPYISYYASSCARPKIAYWASETAIASAEELNGAVEEAATGNWEVSVIPSSSKISIDHINVGVWKDSSGNLTYSTTDGNIPNGKTPGTTGANVGKPNAGTSNGMIYGNGSKNPILGYAITKGSGGYIETAQMRQ